MNEQERAELERLKQRQARLESELKLLSGQLELLEKRLSQPASEAPAPAPKPPTLVPGIEPIRIPAREAAPKAEVPAAKPPPQIPPIPPVILKAPVAGQGTPVRVAASNPPCVQPTAVAGTVPDRESLLKCACQECGGHIEYAAAVAGTTVLCPHCGQSVLLPAPEAPASEFAGAGGAGEPPRPPRPPTLKPQEPAPERSWEMRLGRHWMPRIGIVMVLTGLVFFGNLAYQNFVSKLGAGGKVALLYLASGLLLGAGAWWQRKAAKPSLKNYAQVLFAGGLAAVYFTTYAAYYNEHLRVIQNQGGAGLLLLLWAGFMVWNADRKKSEVLALFAVGLAYYTSIITRVGHFTLYSNLVLTCAAVLFLVRNRWATLSFASLVATYAAYGFWRFFDGSNWHWASPAEGLWAGTYFLMCYWLVFTAAVFLSRHEKFAGQNRSAFITLNNGAFFGMFLLTMLQVQTGGFWKFALAYGSVLLVLAELARRLLPAEPLAKNSYLTQGLLLVTVGFISKYAGLQLALILAMESVLLLIFGQQRKNLVLLVGAYLCAALSVAWGIDGMQEAEPHGLWLAIGLGGLMLVNALLAHRHLVAGTQAAAPAGETGAPAPRSEIAALRGQPAFFTVLALAVWLVATWNNTAHAHFPLVLAAEAVALTLSIYLLRVPEIPLLSQSFMVLAQAAWLVHYVLRPLVKPDGTPPWWSPVLLIGLSLGLSHWWQRQRVLSLRSQFGLLCQGLYALAIVGVLYFWLSVKVGAPAWLALTSLLAVGLTAYGVLTRAWLLAACGQIFMAVSALQFFWQLLEGKPHWPLPLAPIAALALLSFATVSWFQQKPDSTARVSTPLLQFALLYRWAALAMSIWWICEYIPARERIWLLALLGLFIFLIAGAQRNGETLLAGAAFTLTALVLFWLPLLDAPRVYWPNLLVIVVLLAQRQFARRFPERYPLAAGMHGAVILIGGLSLWLFLTRWVLQSASGFYLTASWSALALVLFAVGIALRERVYRWLGLGILGCALGRVMIFDIWKLELVYRVLSLMALGVVLLVLGFVYNKYQDKLRQWL